MNATATPTTLDVGEEKFLSRLDSLAAAFRSQLPTSRELSDSYASRADRQGRSKTAAQSVAVKTLSRFRDLMVKQRQVFSVIKHVRADVMEHDARAILESTKSPMDDFEPMPVRAVEFSQKPLRRSAPPLPQDGKKNRLSASR